GVHNQKRVRYSETIVGSPCVQRTSLESDSIAKRRQNTAPRQREGNRNLQVSHLERRNGYCGEWHNRRTDRFREAYKPWGNIEVGTVTIYGQEGASLFLHQNS